MRLFVIYNISNFDHKLVVVSSSITLYMTSSVRYSWIVLLAFFYPSPLNPHLTYLQVLLTIPIKSCEDPIAQVTPSPSFFINWNFLYHWTSRLRTWS